MAPPIHTFLHDQPSPLYIRLVKSNNNTKGRAVVASSFGWGDRVCAAAALSSCRSWMLAPAACCPGQGRLLLPQYKWGPASLSMCWSELLVFLNILMSLLICNWMELIKCLGKVHWNFLMRDPVCIGLVTVSRGSY